MSEVNIDKIGFQTTLKKSFSLRGISDLHGQRVNIIFNPAPANTGIIFVIAGVPIKAQAQYWSPSQFHTVELESQGKRVVTVEHVLSALFGLGIDNAIIELIGDNQLPIFDGSSQTYVENINRVGRRFLRQGRRVITVTKPLWLASEATDSWMLFLPGQQLAVRAFIDFFNLVGFQDLTIGNVAKQYSREIASARTFFIKPFSQQRWKKFKQIFKTLPDDPARSPIIAYNRQRYLTQLRFADEPVRHKILDCLGDLSLLGYPLQASIIAYKPSHAFTHEAVGKIVSLIRK